MHANPSRHDARHERGSALVVTVAILMALMLIATVMIHMVSMRRESAMQYGLRETAELAALSGQQHAVTVLQTLPAGPTTLDQKWIKEFTIYPAVPDVAGALHDDPSTPQFDERDHLTFDYEKHATSLITDRASWRSGFPVVPGFSFLPPEDDISRCLPLGDVDIFTSQVARAHAHRRTGDTTYYDEWYLNVHGNVPRKYWYVNVHYGPGHYAYTNSSPPSFSNQSNWVTSGDPIQAEAVLRQDGDMFNYRNNESFMRSEWDAHETEIKNGAYKHNWTENHEHSFPCVFQAAGRDSGSPLFGLRQQEYGRTMAGPRYPFFDCSYYDESFGYAEPAKAHFLSKYAVAIQDMTGVICTNIRADDGSGVAGGITIEKLDNFREGLKGVLAASGMGCTSVAPFEFDVSYVSMAPPYAYARDGGSRNPRYWHVIEGYKRCEDDTTIDRFVRGFAHNWEDIHSQHLSFWQSRSPMTDYGDPRQWRQWEPNSYYEVGEMMRDNNHSRALEMQCTTYKVTSAGTTSANHTGRRWAHTRGHRFPYNDRTDGAQFVYENYMTKAEVSPGMFSFAAANFTSFGRPWHPWFTPWGTWKTPITPLPDTVGPVLTLEENTVPVRINVITAPARLVEAMILALPHQKQNNLFDLANVSPDKLPLNGSGNPGGDDRHDGDSGNPAGILVEGWNARYDYDRDYDTDGEFDDPDDIVIGAGGAGNALFVGSASPYLCPVPAKQFRNKRVTGDIEDAWEILFDPVPCCTEEPADTYDTGVLPLSGRLAFETRPWTPNTYFERGDIMFPQTTGTHNIASNSNLNFLVVNPSDFSYFVCAQSGTTGNFPPPDAGNQNGNTWDGVSETADITDGGVVWRKIMYRTDPADPTAQPLGRRDSINGSNHWTDLWWDIAWTLMEAVSYARENPAEFSGATEVAATNLLIDKWISFLNTGNIRSAPTAGDEYHVGSCFRATNGNWYVCIADGNPNGGHPSAGPDPLTFPGTTGETVVDNGSLVWMKMAPNIDEQFNVACNYAMYTLFGPIRGPVDFLATIPNNPGAPAPNWETFFNTYTEVEDIHYRHIDDGGAVLTLGDPTRSPAAPYDQPPFDPYLNDIGHVKTDSDGQNIGVASVTGRLYVPVERSRFFRIWSKGVLYRPYKGDKAATALLETVFYLHPTDSGKHKILFQRWNGDQWP